MPERFLTSSDQQAHVPGFVEKHAEILSWRRDGERLLQIGQRARPLAVLLVRQRAKEQQFDPAVGQFARLAVVDCPSQCLDDEPRRLLEQIPRRGAKGFVRGQD